MNKGVKYISPKEPTAIVRPTLDSTAPELSELSLIQLREMPDEQAAVILDTRLRALEEVHRRSFVARGWIILEMKQRELWRHILDEDGASYTSLERWIVGAATHSRSDCFAALRAVEELREIPKQTLLSLPRCNIAILQSLSSSVRQRPDVIEKAQSMTEREFVEDIKEHFPEQHLEQKRAIHLKPRESATGAIEETIRMAMVLEDTKIREEALEAICAEYAENHREQYEVYMSAAAGRRA